MIDVLAFNGPDRNEDIAEAAMLRAIEALRLVYIYTPHDDVRINARRALESLIWLE